MRHRWLRGVTVTLGAFALLCALLLFTLSQVERRGTAEQADALREAVLRATLTCYAVEGRYPPDAAYLEAYYGLRFDHQRFWVSMRAFADNVLPDILVLTQGES